jgi:hypothetical protein
MAVNGIHKKPDFPPVYIVAAARTPVGMFLGWDSMNSNKEGQADTGKVTVEPDSTTVGRSCNKM